MFSRVTEMFTGRTDDNNTSPRTPKEKKAEELIEQCEKLLDEERHDEAFELAKQAAAIYKELKDKAGIADSVRLQTQFLIHKDERKEAAQLAKEHLAMMEEARDEAGQAKMLLAMADINADRRGAAKRDEGLEQATQALDLFRKLGSKRLFANTLLTLSAIHLKRRPDKMAGAEEAQRCSSEALKIARSIGDKSGEASALHSYAVTTVQISLCDPSCSLQTLDYDHTFEEGIDASRDALRIWQEIGAKRQESYELQCLAQWQILAGHPEEALPDAERSVQIDCQGHKLSSISMHLQALLANQQVDQVLKISEQAVQDYRSNNDQDGELMALDMLINAHRETNQLKEAVECAEEALDILRDKDDLINEMRLQGTIVQIQLARQENVAATEAAEEMLRISEELTDPRAEARARHMMAEVLKAKGDIAGCLKEAKTQQRLFKQADDAKGEAVALLEEADARYLKAEFERALDAATKAQEIYKDAGDKTGEACALGMVAEINQMLSDAEAVLKASARQRSLLKSIRDKKGEASAALQTCFYRLFVLSKSGLQRGSQEYLEVWGRAFKEAKDGMTLAYTHGEDSVYAQSFYLLAQVYLAVNDKGDEALQTATQAAEMYKEIGDTMGQARSQVAVGHAFHLLSKKDQAAEAITEALSLFQEIGDEGGKAMAAQAMQQFLGVGMFQPQQQFGQYDAQVGQQPPDQADGASGQPPAAAAVATGSIKVDPEVIAKSIMDTVTAITMMEVDGDEPLMQSGLTSNTTVLLRNELTQLFPGKHLPFTLVFDFPSINAIADFIAE